MEENMKINTVAVLGAGAIGAYFIWGLTEKMGENLWIIADGTRKDRLSKNGLMINGEKYQLNVKTPGEAKGADLLLVATKYGALTEILDDIERIVDEHTVVLSLLNGVDSEEIIGQRIGMEHMVYSLMKIAAERVGNSIVFDGPTTVGLLYGEAQTGGKKPDTGDFAEQKNVYSDRIKAIAELMDGTKLNYQICDDIIRQIWFKYALNVSQNQPQAIVGCGYGAYDDSEHVGYIRDRLLEEVVKIAAAKGIDISRTEGAAGKRSVALKKARFSTLQDLDAGRHTEVDMFAGAMVRMGKELGIPTPYNELVYHIIKAMEEKNDGMFEYDDDAALTHK
jgi:2-dehydropantoate 2-reductase